MHSFKWNQIPTLKKKVLKLVLFLLLKKIYLYE